MKARACVFAIVLAGCASAPPQGVQTDAARLALAAVPGQATRDTVRAALGPTHAIAFDSGYQAWLYQVPAGSGHLAEVVILFGPDGVVRKLRRRDPSPHDGMNRTP